MLRRKIALYAALGLMLTTSLLHGVQSYEVTMERGVTATMRNGVTLRADIYRPKADGQFPVLLQHTPYNKSGGDGICCHHSGRPGPLHFRRSGTRSSMKRTMVTTPWSGRRRSLIRTAK